MGGFNRLPNNSICSTSHSKFGFRCSADSSVTVSVVDWSSTNLFGRPGVTVTLDVFGSNRTVPFSELTGRSYRNNEISKFFVFCEAGDDLTVKDAVVNSNFSRLVVILDNQLTGESSLMAVQIPSFFSYHSGSEFSTDSRNQPCLLAQKLPLKIGTPLIANFFESSPDSFFVINRISSANGSRFDLLMFDLRTDKKIKLIDIPYHSPVYISDLNSSSKLSNDNIYPVSVSYAFDSIQNVSELKTGSIWYTYRLFSFYILWSDNKITEICPLIPPSPFLVPVSISKFFESSSLLLSSDENSAPCQWLSCPPFSKSLNYFLKTLTHSPASGCSAVVLSQFGSVGRRADSEACSSRPHVRRRELTWPVVSQPSGRPLGSLTGISVLDVSATFPLTVLVLVRATSLDLFASTLESNELVCIQNIPVDILSPTRISSLTSISDSPSIGSLGIVFGCSEELNLSEYSHEIYVANFHWLTKRGRMLNNDVSLLTRTSLKNIYFLPRGPPLQFLIHHSIFANIFRDDESRCDLIRLFISGRKELHQSVKTARFQQMGQRDGNTDWFEVPFYNHSITDSSSFAISDNLPVLTSMREVRNEAKMKADRLVMDWKNSTTLGPVLDFWNSIASVSIQKLGTDEDKSKVGSIMGCLNIQSRKFTDDENAVSDFLGEVAQLEMRGIAMLTIALDKLIPHSNRIDEKETEDDNNENDDEENPQILKIVLPALKRVHQLSEIRKKRNKFLNENYERIMLMTSSAKVLEKEIVRLGNIVGSQLADLKNSEINYFLEFILDTILKTFTKKTQQINNKSDSKINFGKFLFLDVGLFFSQVSYLLKDKENFLGSPHPSIGVNTQMDMLKNQISDLKIVSDSVSNQLHQISSKSSNSLPPFIKNNKFESTTT